MNLSCDEDLGEVVAPCCQASSDTEIVFTGSSGLPPLSSPVRLSVVKRALLTPRNPARSMDYRADRHRTHAPINTSAVSPSASSSSR